MAEAARGVRWMLFVPLVVVVVVLDQLSKAWILANLPPDGAIEVVGTYVRLILTQNTGGLFGLFAGNAPLFALVSIAVMALIVLYESRVGAAIVPTVALGLLLGGAIGNFIDRIRIGYVVDFVDMGIGSFRWYTFNVADAAISTAIVLLLLMAVVPGLAEYGAALPKGRAAADERPDEAVSGGQAPEPAAPPAADEEARVP